MDDNIKKEIKDNLKRWITQQAREYNLKDDEVALIGNDYLTDVIYLHKY